MASANDSWGWLPITIGMAALVTVVVGACLLISRFFPDPGSDVAFVLVLMIPPALMIGVVILARLDLDAGLSEPPKGELETLLERKRHGVLGKDQRQKWDWIVAGPPPPTEPQTHVMAGVPDAGDPLDRLVRRKRMGKLGRPR